jgi:hypothetical protein
MTDSAISRNAPCPCGSGKKYKQCHLGKDLPGSARGRKMRTLVILALLAIVVGVVVAIQSTAQNGLAVGGGALMLIAIVAGIRKPPPPNPGAGDPAGLNFGG